MLANNEPVQGVDLAATFEIMLRDLPWNDLKIYVQANAPVLKRCTVGGHRLEKKHRKRSEGFIVKEAVKAEFSQTFCSGLFAQWYPVHAELHGELEGYFHSDEYAAYRTEHELTEDDYVLSDELFDKFFDVKDLPKWRVLLCFSPLQFSSQQAERVLADGGASEVFMAQLEDSKGALDALAREKAKLGNENDDLRNRLKQLTEEAQEVRNERKALRAELATFQKRFEASQNENKRLRGDLSDKHETLQEHQEQAGDKIAREANRFKRDLERSGKELENWQSRYESQRSANRGLTQQLKEIEEALSHQKNVAKTCQRNADESRHFANALLAQIDWPEVGAQLHLTPQLKRKFNSLVKKLNYDENRALSLGGTLPEFWGKLQEQERRLVDAVAASDVREIQDGDVEAFWRGLTDSFEDVYIGLEARALLLKMLQEIFYQTLDMEDLKSGALPGTAKGKTQDK